MKNAVLAILASVAMHAALAAVFAAMFWTRGENDFAETRLDLSKMDFSFAENEDANAAAAAVLPQSAAREAPPRHTVAAPDEPQTRTATADPVTPDIPEPDETSAVAEMTPPPPAPRQAGIDAPPRPKSSIRPEYPVESRKRGEQGSVTLEISVDAAGTVSGARILSSSGFPALDGAAVKAVRGARFVPAKSNGRPVAGRVSLTLLFRLKGRGR